MSEWSIRNLWRYSHWIERLVFVALALMLVYTFLVLIRFSRHHYLARRESSAFEADSWPAFEGDKRRLVADQSWVADSESNHLLGAIPWTCGNKLRNSGSFVVWRCHGEECLPGHDICKNRRNARLDCRGNSGDYPGTPGPQLPPHAHRPLRSDASTKEAILKPASIRTHCSTRMASVVLMFMAFEPYERPTGLHVGLIPDRCVDEGDDRLIIMRLTGASELFINEPPEDPLPEVLSKIPPHECTVRFISVLTMAFSFRL